jgi:hypothetical protein
VTAVAVALAACGGDDESPRMLIVEETLELCASASVSTTPLDLLRATQWRLTIPEGEYALPREQAPVEAIEFFPDVEPLGLAVDLRNAADERPLDEGSLDAAVVDSVSWRDGRDLAWAERHGEPPFESGNPWRFGLGIAGAQDGDFVLHLPETDLDVSIGFGCTGDVISGPCPDRSFVACEPGAATVRTRVVLESGELVLDVWRAADELWSEGRTYSMLVEATVELDGVMAQQLEYDSLLFGAGGETPGQGRYGVLAPELDDAGLGCGVVFEDDGVEAARAYTVDCDLQALDELAIVEIVREPPS